MGKVIATCGHEITSDWMDSRKGNITIKDYNREWKKCICYMIVCPKCLKFYKKEDVILKTEQEAKEWLN